MYLKQKDIKIPDLSVMGKLCKLMTLFLIANIFTLVKSSDNHVLDSERYLKLSDGYEIRGRMIEYASVRRRIACGTQCSAQYNCIGFVTISAQCNIIFSDQGPDAIKTASNNTNTVWMKYLYLPRSCVDVQYLYQEKTSGKYWIVLPDTNTFLEVYCDMMTGPGGWTLVWSYELTDYLNFDQGSNAVEPIPSWGITNTNVQISQKTPTSPDDLAAMTFALWIHIGGSFMVRSNINNGIQCTPTSGSLVEEKSGIVHCSLTNGVIQNGCALAPGLYAFDLTFNHIKTGPFLGLYPPEGSGHMYYWDGNTVSNWPTHDPCTGYNGNQKHGVSNPGGQLYLRDYPKSCQELKIKYPWVKSGQHWILINDTNEPVEVYCDMNTASGGWTLVWSYGFTDYNNFQLPGNAVTPRPSTGWTTGTTDVLESKTIPLSPDTHGAMEFALWQQIGKEFMVRSNINNEIMCTPGTGSVVEAKSGTVTCKLIADVVQNGCKEVPNMYNVSPTGAGLLGNALMYYWDGSTIVHWPVHDPCSQNQANQKSGVVNPGGQLYLRM